MISVLKIAKSKYFKKLCLTVAVINILPLFYSTAKAISGGPTQPEYQKFSVINNGDFVDPFTGDMKYSIPLFEIGGYPVSLSYSGNISPTQDAGWVGLGWALNVGSIARHTRGVPDDFNGDEVKITHYEKPHRYYHVRANYHRDDNLRSEKGEVYQVRTKSSMLSVTGKAGKYVNSKFNISYPGIIYDNYAGIGFEYDINFQLGIENTKVNEIVSNLKKSNWSYWESKFPKVFGGEFQFLSLDYNYSRARAIKFCNFPDFDMVKCNKAKDDSTSAGIKYRNYYSTKVRPFEDSISAAQKKLNQLDSETQTPPYLGIFNQSLNYNSLHGIQYDPLAGFTGMKFGNVLRYSPGLLFNSRAGLAGISHNVGETGANSTPNWSYYMPLAGKVSFPEGNFDINNISSTIHYKTSLAAGMHNRAVSMIIDYNLSQPKHNGKEITKNAYGYFYQNDIINTGDIKSNVIIDCENQDKSWDRNTKALPIPAKDFDYYSISGSGVGGSFRACDINPGIIGPVPQRAFNVKSINFGGEKSGGTPIRVGLDLGADGEIMKCAPWAGGSWGKQNKISENLNSNTNGEGYTLRNEYEFMPVDDAYYSKLGWFGPIAADLKGKSKARIPRTNDVFRTIDGNYAVSGKIGKAQQREARQQVISFLTAKESSKVGFMKEIECYKYENDLTPGVSGTDGNKHLTKTTFYRGETTAYPYRKAHHISEFTVTQPDGSRYYYGIPVYNINETDVTFSVDHNSNIKLDKGQYNYSPENDAKMLNDNGIDHYYHKKTVPGYTTAHLLSAVLSPDYSDLTQNGPTPDDLGNYVKFNYSQPYYWISPNNESFNWRTPNDENYAHYNEGFKSDKLDDKAYFNYGKREMWYLHSIESKDRIALFFLGNREDGYESAGEHGGQGSKCSKYLKKVLIFSRNDFEKSGLNAIPLQTINLEYSYDLCANAPGFKTNSTNTDAHPLASFNPTVYNHSACANKGKLTLHKIWMTYSGNNFPSSAPYVFEYKGKNPEYHERKTDRWGTYADVYNPDRPYTETDSLTAAQNASAWMMTDVYMPSGGHLSFEYESDDYNYVMDRKVMQMTKIIGAREDDNYTGSFTTNDFNNMLQKGEGKPVNYLYFEKQAGYLAKDYYSSDEPFIYFSFKVNLGSSGLNSADKKWEIISGFAEVDKVGDVAGSNYGYIKIKPIALGRLGKHRLETNVITKMAWQYAVSNVPFTVYPNSSIKREDEATQKAKKIAAAYLGAIPELYQMIIGPSRYFSQKWYGAEFVKNESYLRTFVPGGKKYGGGHRVKRVKVDDNWNNITTGKEESTSYSLEYSYSTKDEKGLYGSGVAAYEPITGGDENPFRQPDNYNGLKKLFKSGKNRANLVGQVMVSYDLEPLGEEFYPSANVGYSKIAVKTVIPSGVNISRHAPGYKVVEFYTAKDFPVIAKKTSLEQKNLPIMPLNYKDTARKGVADTLTKKVSSNIIPWVNVKLHYSGASQGYYIEHNDMHGKPKASWDYPAVGESPTSGVEYFYKRDLNGNLNNEITLLNPNNTVVKKIYGINLDPTFYASRLRKTDIAFDLKADIDITTPVAIPNASFGLNINRQDNRMFVVSKLAFRQGILETVVAYNKGSKSATKNLAWDALTGQVLLTQIENEYRDPVYQLTKPAYWMYEGLSGSYQNLDYQGQLDTIQDNYHTLVDGIVRDNQKILFPGDELVFYDSSWNLIENAPRAWVLDIDRTTKRATLIDKDGKSMILAPLVSAKYPWKDHRKNGLNTSNVYPATFTSTYFQTHNRDSGSIKIKVLRSGHRNNLGAAAESITLHINPIRSDNTFCNYDSVVNATATSYTDRRMVYRGDRFCLGFKCNPEIQYPETETGSATPWNHRIMNQDISFNELVFNSLNKMGPKDPTAQDLTARPGDCCAPDTGAASVFIGPFSGGSGKACYTININGWKTGDIINPFLWDLKGYYRPYNGFVYFDRRNASYERSTGQSNSTNANTTNMRMAGFLESFVPFWNYNSTQNNWNANNVQGPNNPWTWKDSVINTDFWGNDLQEINVAQISSSALSGYNNRLTYAVVPNAKLQEILFDGFEDYHTSDFISGGCSFGNPTLDTNGSSWFNSFSRTKTHYHWPLYKALIGSKNRIHDGIAHTGYQSLQIGDDTTVIGINTQTGTNPTESAGIKLQKYLKNEDFIDAFNPIANKDLITSIWVKESWENQFKLEFRDQNGQVISITQEEKPVYIDGWKRLVYRFKIPSGKRLAEIRYINKFQSNANPLLKYVYLDDFRIFPASTNMVSYVYKQSDQRLMATLDANNFAAFNQYDAEGNLVSKKIETERGVMTVSEQRSSNRKKN